MDFNTIVGIVTFLVMMVMILGGIPIFVSMLTCSFVGFIVLFDGNITMAITQFTTAPFSLAGNYNYAVLPLFMLVGTLAGETGIAEDAFAAIRSFLGRVKGGTLFTVIGANAVFGACSGSSIAGNVVFGKLAMPTLDKEGYDRKYAMGCITAAGALSTLIPPSMGILMFCLVVPANLSVSTALVGGIGPGILTAIALGITVRVIGVVKKGSIPEASGEKVPASEKIKGLKLLLPILFLFALIIGGSAMGWFPATVGGAIGAVACCLYAFAKRMPLKKLAGCMWEAAVMNAGIFPIIIGGQIFGRFVSATGIAATLANAIAGVNAPPFIIFLLVIILYIFCGCVMDIVSIIIITVPIVFPVLTGLGYDPYVLVIALCFMTEIAGLTPPIGMNVFATANALRVKPMEIFSGVIPYVVCEFAMVLLVAHVPQIVTFIPSLF